jgi:hypothetical protein
MKRKKGWFWLTDECLYHDTWLVRTPVWKGWLSIILKNGMSQPTIGMGGETPKDLRNER